MCLLQAMRIWKILILIHTEMEQLAHTRDYLAILTENTKEDLLKYQEAWWKLIEIIPDDYCENWIRFERNMILFGKWNRWNQ